MRDGGLKTLEKPHQFWLFWTSKASKSEHITHEPVRNTICSRYQYLKEIRDRMECQLTIDYKKIQKCIAKKFLWYYLVMMLISQLLTAEKHKKS